MTDTVGPTPVLSVVIPVFNGEEAMRVCLSSLFASEFKDFEAIVVDDKSTDGTASIASEFPCKLIRSQANNGPASARNLGVSHSAGKYLFFLDADILIDTDSLGQVVQTLDSRPEIDALFGSFHPDSVPRNFFSRYKNLVHHYTHQNSREDASTFCGGFGAIRRDVFIEVGGFDPQFRYLEDVEMGIRLHSAGSQIWLHKKLRFHHCKRYTFAALIRSDLFQRAVPWTRLILRSGSMRNDLNTKTCNVLSVPISYLLLLGAPALAFKYGAVAWYCLAVALVTLNQNFLAMAWRKFGAWFALRAVFTCWMIYLFSGLGFVLGAFGHLSDELRGAVAEAAEPAP